MEKEGALGVILKHQHVTVTQKSSGKRSCGHQSDRTNGGRSRCGTRTVASHNHTRRNQRLDELIAAYAAMGFDPGVLREVVGLATAKGIRKLAHGFLC
jgi:hypothetical protein